MVIGIVKKLGVRHLFNRRLAARAGISLATQAPGMGKRRFLHGHVCGCGVGADDPAAEETDVRPFEKGTHGVGLKVSIEFFPQFRAAGEQLPPLVLDFFVEHWKFEFRLCSAVFGACQERCVTLSEEPWLDICYGISRSACARVSINSCSFPMLAVVVVSNSVQKSFSKSCLAVSFQTSFAEFQFAANWCNESVSWSLDAEMEFMMLLLCFHWKRD